MNEHIRITTETNCQEAMLLGASNEGVAMIAPQKKKKRLFIDNDNKIT